MDGTVTQRTQSEDILVPLSHECSALVLLLTSRESQLQGIRAIDNLMPGFNTNQALSAASKHISQLFFEADAVRNIVPLLHSRSLEIIRYAASASVKICRHPPSVGAFVDAGVIPRLVEHLSSPDPDILIPLLKLLSELAAGIPQSQGLIITEGAWPLLLRLLSSSNDAVIQATAEAISGVQYIDSAVARGLVGLLSHRNEAVVQAAARTISSITIGSPVFFLQAGAVRPFVNLLSSRNAGVQATACEAIANIACGSPLSRNAFMDGDRVVLPVVHLLSSPNLKVLLQATMCIIFLTTSRTSAMKFSMAGAVPLLKSLAQKGNDELGKYTRVAIRRVSRWWWWFDHATYAKFNESDRTPIAAPGPQTALTRKALVDRFRARQQRIAERQRLRSEQLKQFAEVVEGFSKMFEGRG